MRFAAVHIPEFPALALASADSSPLVVLDGTPPQERVVSFCATARAVGVRHGMSKVQAEAACPGVFVKRDTGAERRAFERLCSVTDAFSPRIQAVSSVANAYGGNTQLAAALLLDATGMGTLFGTDVEYGRRLYKVLRSEGLSAGLGIAVTPNAEAALMLARSAPKVIIADNSTLPGKLAQLPVTLLPCEQRILNTLSRWGIRTLGQLASLPEAALISRLGQHGGRLQALARGSAQMLLIPEQPAFVLSEATLLDTPVELLDSLLFIVSPLLDAVMRKAVERAYALRSVTLTLTLDTNDKQQHMLRVQPALLTQNRDVLLKLLNLELQAKPPKAGIVEVALSAEAAQPTRAQRGLFQAQFPEPDRLDLLLARLRAIVGEENVGSPHLLNTHRSCAFAMAPFNPLQACTQNDVQDASFGLALRAFRPAQPARVTCWGERPKLLYWAGAKYLVNDCAGPWHSSGAWWDERAWQHELWDVSTNEPVQVLRLQHETASGRWSVVGIYD